MLEPHHPVDERCLSVCKDEPEQCPANTPQPPRRALRFRRARRSTRTTKEPR